MCRVPRQEHASLAPMFGNTRAEGVDCLALQPHRAFDVPGFHQLFDEGVVAHLFGRFVRFDHEFPTVPPFPHQHAGCWPLGIANLQICGGQPGIVVHEHIDDEPRFFEAEVVKVDARHFANGRTRTVRTDKIPRTDCLIAIRRVDLCGDEIAFVLKTGQFPPAVQRC